MTGSPTTLLCLAVVVATLISNIQAGPAGGSCPLASKVYGCSPKCIENYECTNGKICCQNSCNTKSCVEKSAYGGAGGAGDKYSQSGGAGTYCNNVKCSSFEVCKLDPSTKRMKCMRA